MNREALRLLGLLRHYAGNEDDVDWDGFNKVEAEFRAFLSAQEPTGWRPIETAPERVQVLVWIPSTDLAWPAWREGDKLFSNAHGPLNTPDERGRSLLATHWRPLTAPPGELAKQEAK